jgi:hypothetical protein
MAALHKRVSDKEVLVGWYSTWDGGSSGSDDEEVQPVEDFTVAVHQFFSDLIHGIKPVHLYVLRWRAYASDMNCFNRRLVDVSLKTDKIGIQAYVASPNNLLRK